MVAVEADDSELDCLRDEEVELRVVHHAGVDAQFEESEGRGACFLESDEGIFRSGVAVVGDQDVVAGVCEGGLDSGVDEGGAAGDGEEVLCVCAEADAFAGWVEGGVCLFVEVDGWVWFSVWGSDFGPVGFVVFCPAAGVGRRLDVGVGEGEFEHG